MACKIVACSTDNAFNIAKCVTLGYLLHVPWFAHSLNQVVQSSITEISDVREKVKSIEKHFKRSPQAISNLNNTQKQISLLKQDCPTR